MGWVVANASVAQEGLQGRSAEMDYQFDDEDGANDMDQRIPKSSQCTRQTLRIALAPRGC